MRKRMKMLGFDIGRSDSQIVPLVLGSNETTLRFAKALSSSGFAVSAIRPPSVPVGTARLRLSLNTNLSFTDIDSFLDASSKPVTPSSCASEFGSVYNGYGYRCR